MNPDRANPVIVTEHLGKRYRVGTRSAPYSTLRDTVANVVRQGARRTTAIARGDRASAASARTAPEIWAVRDVSFSVARGSVLGVIGVNGAGKSTLLKLLSRITEPTTGRFRLKGRVASLLEVGTGFHRELTGRENIFLNGAILGMRRAEIKARFDEIVAFAEVEEFVDTPVKHYSSGMYVRLAFAVAANLEPDILVVDEVLAVGDAQFQRRCLGKMQDVSRNEGRTVLFVSHAMASVRALCTEAIWMDRGSIRVRGGAGDVIQQYLESTLETSAVSYPLDSLPRHWPGHGENLRLMGVTVNGGQPVFYDEPFRVEVEYEVRAPLADVGFEIGFSSLEAVRVLTVDSNLERPGEDFHAAQRGVIEAEIAALHLQPGRYTMDIAVRSGDHAGLDYLPACVAFQIIAGPRAGSVIFRETTGVRQPARWSGRSIGASAAGSPAEAARVSG
jgi:lipopolysaccharide transport system ATP-binding protein